MSAFELDISEEEERSGFELGAPDDESFKLEKLDEYPGVLPDFGIEEEPMIPIESDDLEPEPEIEEEPEEEVLDLEEEEETLDVEEEFEGGAFVDSDDDFENETYDEEEVSDFVADDDEIEEVNEEDFPEFGESDDSGAEEVGEVDPELQDILQSELQRSQDHKASKGEDALSEEDRIEVVYDEFVPVEEQDDDFNEVDITDYAPDVDVAATPGAPQGKKESAAIDEDLFTEDEDDNKKNRKKAKPISTRRMYAIIGTPVTLLLILFGLGYFRVINVPGMERLHQADTTATDLVVDPIEEIPVQNQTQVQTPVKEEIAVQDTIPETIDTMMTAEVEKLESSDQKIEKEEKIPEVEEKQVAINTVVPEKRKPVVKNEVVIPTKKTKTQNKDIATTKKPKVKPSGKNEKKQEVKIPAGNRKPDSDVGLFTIQIYASPSKKDAEDWLSKLKDKDINDAFISEQLVRDEVWYRVRFGGFKTKQEAQAAAQKLGYSQTWIDRVK